MVLKHIGLFLVVGSPLMGMINLARARLKGLWRRDDFPRRLERFPRQKWVPVWRSRSALNSMI